MNINKLQQRKQLRTYSSRMFMDQNLFYTMQVAKVFYEGASLNRLYDVIFLSKWVI